MKIVIDINEKEEILTMDKAEKLWRELDKIFKKNDNSVGIVQRNRPLQGTYFGQEYDGFNLDSSKTLKISC